MTSSLLAGTMMATLGVCPIHAISTCCIENGAREIEVTRVADATCDDTLYGLRAESTKVRQRQTIHSHKVLLLGVASYRTSWESPVSSPPT
jgi:hypothetical protein